MTCDQALELIQRGLDGDLNQLEEQALMSHTAHCEDCARLQEQLRRLSGELESLPPVTPPYSLVDAILPQLDSMHGKEGGAAGAGTAAGESVEAKSGGEALERSARRPARSRTWPIVGGSAAAALLLGILIFGTVDFRGSPGTDAATNSAASSASGSSSSAAASNSASNGAASDNASSSASSSAPRRSVQYSTMNNAKSPALPGSSADQVQPNRVQAPNQMKQSASAESRASSSSSSDSSSTGSAGGSADQGAAPKTNAASPDSVQAGGVQGLRISKQSDGASGGTTPGGSSAQPGSAASSPGTSSAGSAAQPDASSGGTAGGAAPSLAAPTNPDGASGGTAAPQTLAAPNDTYHSAMAPDNSSGPDSSGSPDGSTGSASPAVELGRYVSPNQAYTAVMRESNGQFQAVILDASAHPVYRTEWFPADGAKDYAWSSDNLTFTFVLLQGGSEHQVAVNAAARTDTIR